MSLRFPKKIFFIFLFNLIFSGMFLFAQEVTTLTIENAQQTEYKKNEETGNDSIFLSGAVELSVEKDGVKSIIKADKISYDRVTEMLLAEGNVEITTTGNSSGGETATASSLLMNTSTLEGVFADGRVIQTQSDAINLPSGSTLIVFSEVFGKSASNTIAFKNSSLTFCDDENPHWHINSTRTWLLPGGEFAFFNALLYVGPVPVFYLPAFYYPKDELVFNPSFGYRERAGYFVNTTTYLMGRKPLNNSSSSGSSEDSDSLQALYNFMKPGSLKKQKLEGLVLHNLEEDYTGDTSHYVKLMADWYSNLGAMVGIDGVVSPKASNYLSDIKFTFDLGFSNTVFADSGNYIAISRAGQRYWDKSNFLGLKLPFRYGGNIDLTLNKPFRLSLSLPVYSDPYFSHDFKNRQESMDWISLFTSNSNTDDTSTSEISSYTWKLSGSYSPVIPVAVKNIFSSASLSFNSSINISSATNNKISSDSRAGNSDGWSSRSPERRFYYPSLVTPLSVSMNVSGTLVQYPKVPVSNSAASGFAVNLLVPDELKTSSELEKEKLAAEEQAKKTEDKEAGADNKEEVAVEVVEPVLPEIQTTLPSMTSIAGLNYKLSYSANPSVNTQILYNPSDSPNDFKWDKIKGFMYQIKSPLSLNSNFSYGGSFFSMSNRLSYEPVWQAHPNADGYTEEQKTSLKLSDYNSESQNVLNTNSLSIKPFLYIPAISETGISWNSSMKIFRRKFIGDGDNPEWENHLLDFTDSESVTAHSLDFRFSAKEMNSKFTQSFSYSTTLAPQLPRHSFALNLVFPYVTANFGTSFQQTSITDKTMIYNPFQQSISVNLFDSKLRFSESWNWNYKENHNDSLKLSLNWKTLSASYVMSYTNGYDFDSTEGWIARTDKEFLPSSASFSYNPSTKEQKFFQDNVTFSVGLNTSIVADLLRPTNSYFSFNPSLTFKINDFFNLTFSSTSKNSVIYRYFQKALGADGRIPGEQNPVIDLLNSFRFDSSEKRKASGYKLKSLNMSISHELHDWDFSMNMKFEPRLVTKNGSRYYDYSPYISIGIFWRPMSSMKTQITDDYGQWKLE